MQRLNRTALYALSPQWPMLTSMCSSLKSSACFSCTSMNSIGISENELKSFATCLSYVHMNFLFVVMLIMDKDGSEVDDTENYAQCKSLLKRTAAELIKNWYRVNFRSQNKIIKSVLCNLLSNLNEINSQTAEVIEEILNSTKTKSEQTVYSELIANAEKESKLKSIELKEEQAEDLEVVEEEEEENIPQPAVPYLSKRRADDNRSYSLVLDLDETLVHFFEGDKDGNAYVKVRIGTEAFLASLAKHFELIIFTARTKYYADIVVDGLDRLSS